MDADRLRFASLFPEFKSSPAAIALAIRPEAEPGGSWFVPLHEVPDGVAFLGALVDAQGRRRVWLEIWVQTVGRSAWRPIVADASWNNAALDQRWRNRMETLDRLMPDDVWLGPWSSQPQPPLVLLTSEMKFSRVIPPGADEQVHWRLCTDDNALRTAGLPEYSRTSHRYLYLSGSPAPPFIPITPGSPQPVRVGFANAQHGFGEGIPLFNFEGGLLFVRTFAPLSLAEFKRVLDGYSYEGTGSGKDKLFLSPSFAFLGSRSPQLPESGLIFTGHQGVSNRQLECFLLKLMLLREVIATVAAVTRREQRPFLDLGAEDFRISLQPSAIGLPFWWSFRVHLVRTSDAMALPVAENALHVFRSPRQQTDSPYRAPAVVEIRTGVCQLRIREVVVDDRGQVTAALTKVTLTGTLSDFEGSPLVTEQLLELGLLVGGVRHTFLARPLAGENLAMGEVRFETIPLSIRRDAATTLLGQRGPWPERVTYRLTPLLSSPADLWSLAVMGIELLLDTRKVPLQIARDECLSLAAEIARSSVNARAPLAHRRAEIIERYPAFQQHLGPQNLNRESSTDTAGSLVPEDLWWSAFDILVKMLPGPGRDAWAAHLGDVNPQAIDGCYTEVLSNLGNLCEQIKAILFGDLPSNQEVLSIIADLEPGS